MPSPLLITNARLLDSQSPSPVSILIANGKIDRIAPATESLEAQDTFDARGNLVVPGFIDVHIQGAGGADVLDATPEAIATIARTSARFGVTGFLATTVFRPEGDNRHLSVAADLTGADLGGARLLGAHLEGPFISLKKRGMIRPDCIGLPSARILDEIQSLAKGTLRMMTIAPNCPIASPSLAIWSRPAAWPRLPTRMQPTTRPFGDSMRAYRMSRTCSMPCLRCTIVNPDRCRPYSTVRQSPCRSSRTACICTPRSSPLSARSWGSTDAFSSRTESRQWGFPMARTRTTAWSMRRRGGVARYHDGTLVGTAVGLSELVKRFVRFTGCSLLDAIRTVTEVPAKVLALYPRKGTIREGCDADLTVIDDAVDVRATIVGGQIVYEKAGNCRST